MSAGTSRLYLSLRAFIPQHAQHWEIKDTEMLFNHYTIVLLAFAFTPHPVNLHGLLLCCQLISHPPAPAEQPAVAGLRRERETLVAVRKRKGMKHRDKSLCHIEQVPQFRSPLIIPMLLKTQRAHILACLVFFSVRVFKMVRKCVWVFLSVETYGFTDALLSNSSCLASGLLSSGHNIVVYHWEISTTHIHLIYSAI